LNDIVIVGAGGHARVVLDVIRLTRAYNPVGFIDSTNPQRWNTQHEGLPILGGEDTLTRLRAGGITHAVVAIGGNEARMRVAADLVRKDFTLATLIHPGAIVAERVAIGAGTVVFAGAIVNPATRIGANVILNTGCTVDHDCDVGDGAHLAPGVHIAGHVTVGSCALVGVGAAVRPGVKIGSNAVVGVGAAVVSDVADGVTVTGVPAREVK
jgi:UDP-N-acetylbacillosamine N-acetyltransferase